MRRKRRNQKRQIKIFIGLIICFLLVMTVGYAAFSTTLTLNAKGSIKEIPIAADKLKQTVVTSGEGLYIDSYDNSRYVYRGEKPDNYIVFNNELWRIMALEADGSLKITSDNSAGADAFDSADSRPTASNTYCTMPAYGCNVWNAISGNYTNGSYTGTVTKDATLNTYLNTNYYSALDETAKGYIQSHNFYTGPVNADMNVVTIIANEQKLSWQGNIGLMTLSDYIKASLNTQCSSSITMNTNNSSNYPCKDKNYLQRDVYQWTITPTTDNPRWVIRVNDVGEIIDVSARSNPLYFYPVVFLKSDIKLSGAGTETVPYQIH